MARISKRGRNQNHFDERANWLGTVWKAGIYARLSVDSHDKKNESIDTQIEIAKELPNLVDYHLFQKSGHNILNDCEYKDAMARVKMWLRA